ncbi:MAG TPA: hypothetical protein VN893_20410 [Bryobacteraceae bacterium]|nr:hypothetical protein [Bryobacteraceae bacterium]
MGAEIRVWWKDRRACRSLRAGVSLHSHTLHSREYLTFVPRYLKAIPLLAWLARREARWHGVDEIPHAEFARVWWTPPLSAHAAWLLEKSSIEDRLQRRALVSITDHDNIEAAGGLHTHEESRHTPVSLEWTVPFRGASFHVGVHNLPPECAHSLVRRMNEYTAGGSEALLAQLLEEVGGYPETLVVLNHPFWDEDGVSEDLHRGALGSLLGLSGRWLHALELNADRPWRENLDTIELARANNLPVVSGGDRHGCDPSPVLNLTNATDFGEFAEEVRSGHSTIVLLPRLRESRKVRLFETAFDILRDHPAHSLGWVRWSDRVFYQGQDGTVTSLAQLWGCRQPGAVSNLVGLMGLLGKQTMRPALRWALAERAPL